MKQFLIGLVLIGLVATPTFAAESSKESKNAGDKEKSFAGGGMFTGRLMEQLNLTDEQKRKFQELREKYAPDLKDRMQKAKEQLESILTEDQKKKMRELHQEGVRGKELFEKLDLTDEQKQKMREMREKGAEQAKGAFKEHQDEFRNILTDEQKAKLKELMEKARERHGKRDKSNS